MLLDVTGALCQRVITFSLLLLGPLQARLALKITQPRLGGVSGSHLLLLRQSATESRLIIVVSASDCIGTSAEVVDFVTAACRICPRVRSSTSRGWLEAASEDLLLLVCLELTEMELILG